MLPLTFSLLAQTPSSLEVQGQINDGASPIPGATVLIKGEQRGTVSDFNGHFEINTQPNDTIVISYIGYATVEAPVNNRTNINITMQEDATTLREVVINAGYYSVKDRERTGSISRITAEEIEKQPINNPLEAMQGRMTGVDIVQNSGVTGGGFEVRIRGQNSIMAGNAPLYIIDGVPFDSQSLGSSGSSVTIIPEGNISPLNAINPDAIESIEVLKDADATAIYGSRGANGVILITTKKGKSGKTSFTINSSTGIASITGKRELMDTEKYLEMRREAFANDGITDYPATAYDVNGTWDQNRYTDWQDVLIGGTAKTRQLQATISGGNENTRFLLSGMHQNETTVFPGNFDYDRVTVNANIHHSSANDRLSVTFSTGYTIENNTLPGTDLTSNAYRLSPNAPALYDDEGNLNWENSTWTNPLAQLEGKYKNNSKNLIANAVVNYKLFSGLEFKVNTGYNFTVLEDNNTIPHTVYDPAFGLNSSVSQSYSHNTQRSSYIIEPQLNWGVAKDNHKWEVLLGSTFQSRENEVLTLLGYGFANNSFLGNLSGANTLIILNENTQEYKYQSFFARINYAFKDKVFINATGRRDGSSRFGPENRFGNFGALGAAWIFSEDLKWNWLNFGKLRGSYGITGNDQIGNYQYLQTYTIGDYPYDGNIGLLPTRLLNPNFKWEQNVKKEAAVELGLLNQRLSLSIAYYNNRSSNQLISYALPGTTGFTSIQDNLDAVVQNTGWEFEVDVNWIKNTHFKWHTSFNLTMPKNKLLEFPGLEDSSYANRYAIGKPLSIVWVYKFNGVNPDTGLFEFEDYNNDGMVTGGEDRQYIVDVSPKLLGGISNSITYKNWAMDIFFQFVKKKGYNQYFNGLAPGTMFNQPIEALDRWQSPGDQATMQQFTTGANPEAMQAFSNFAQSNAAVTDASFLRLKSMMLHYTLPLKSNWGTSCRISIQGQNLLTFTDFKGADPEQYIGYLPALRRVTLGLQVNL